MTIKTKTPHTDDQPASPPDGTPQKHSERIAELEAENAQLKADNLRLLQAQKPTQDTPHAQPWEVSDTK